MSLCYDNLPVLQPITKGALWTVLWWAVNSNGTAEDYTGQVFEVLFDNIETNERLIVTEPLGTGSDDLDDDFTGVTHADDETYVTIKLSTTHTATHAALSSGKCLITIVIDGYVTDRAIAEIEILPGGVVS